MPQVSEKDVAEIRIKSLWYQKRFYVDLKAFIKPFEVSKRKLKNQIYVIVSSGWGLGLKGLTDTSASKSFNLTLRPLEAHIYVRGDQKNNDVFCWYFFVCHDLKIRNESYDA